MCSSACSVIGPHPDATLSSLAGQALRDAQSWESSDPGLAALRQDQSEKILAEVSRDCGHYDDGSAPPACSVDSAALAAEAADLPPQASLHALVDAIDNAPEDSRELLTRLSLDFAGALRPQGEDEADVEDLSPAAGELARNAAEPPALSSKDRKSAAELLRTEWATIWGIDSAKGLAAPAQRPALVRSSQCHRDAAEGIRRAFSAAEDTAPEPQPGYQIPEASLPTTAEEADNFIATLERDSQQRWATAIAAAHQDGWRRWLTTTAVTVGACSSSEEHE